MMGTDAMEFSVSLWFVRMNDAFVTSNILYLTYTPKVVVNISKVPLVNPKAKIELSESIAST